MDYPILNKYQTPLDDKFFSDMPEECIQQFWEFFNQVPMIQTMVSTSRKRACDIERDDKGRIIVDIVNPHILENMDYFTPAANHYRKYGCYTFLKPNPNKNSEFGRWIREETRRCWNGYVRESDGEWITGYCYYYLNYARIELSKFDPKNPKKASRVEDFPKFWEGVYYMFHYYEQARFGGIYNNWEGGNFCAVLAKRGASKALSYDESVLTPDGWKFWCQIKKGDYLFGDDGKPTKVIDIPYDDPHCGVYTVTLQDGREILASEDHLFTVKDHYRNNKIVTIPLSQMIGKEVMKRTKTSKCTNGREYQYRIPVCKCLEFEYKNTPIDPYTLGFLVGDGCFRKKKSKHVNFTAHKDDIDTYRKFIPYEFHKVSNDNYTYSLSIDCDLFGDLWSLKSEDKYIPDEYIYNSKEVRLNVLRGLMDSDGIVSKGNMCFTTTSEALKDSVVTIVRTLGFNCNVSKHKSSYKKNGEVVKCLDSYDITIFAEERLFNLERKYSKVIYNKSNRSKWTAITNIEFLGYTGAKCVTVDNKSHCFVAADQIVTHNSYTMSSMLAHDFILGENEETKEGGVMGVNMAYSKEYLQGKDGCLNKFQKTIDWCADKMHWPSLRLTERPDDMIWVMGYRDKENGIIRGTQNTIVGVTIADKVGKARGKRAAHIFFEEFGSFPNLSKVFENTIPSVKDGDAVFGQIIMVGTAGDNASDFAGASDIMYHPEGSMMYGLPNVYDKIGTGKKKFVYFFPAYMSRTGCMDEDGNSDVTLALKKILLERFQAKYNSNDPDKIIKRMAENPIVPSEAIISMAYNMFPSVDCGNRIAQLDNNAGEYDDVLVGDLIIEKNGEIGFRPTNDQPIHIFPTKDNKVKGAIEIFAQPEINERTKKPFDNRYIAGVDPYDNDQAESMSLGSIFILDLWTDKIVAEYTGRPDFANDFYEICRRLCLYYNARCNYENNKKGLFTYFSQMSSTYLLTDSLQCLRDKQMFKGNTIGNCAKGTVATPGVNDWARHLLRDWLLKPVTVIRQNDDGTEREETTRNLFLIRNRALLQECAVYNSEGNFDRISSMGMLMLLREDRMIAYGGDPSMDEVRKVRDERMDDPFFNKFDDEIDGDNFNPMDFSF